MVALVGIVMTLVTLVASRRAVGLSGWGRWAALGAFLVAVAQIPMGGITIALDLHPLAVMTHFLLGLTAFGLALVAALEAWSLRDGLAVPVGALWLRLLVTCVGLPTCIALVVTGAVATASGPHPGSSDDVERLGLGIVDTVHVHVRVAAAFGIGVLVVGWLLSRLRGSYPGLLRIWGGLLCSSRRRSWARCSTAMRCRGGSSSSTLRWRRRSGPLASASRSSSGGRPLR
jgi:cytochrome c oxidase assembly protein subunit 15